jgi:hypothetical protein
MISEMPIRRLTTRGYGKPAVIQIANIGEVT